MNTDPLDNCPANSSIDAWSPDFNGGAMSSGDLVAFAKYYAGSGTTPAPRRANRRRMVRQQAGAGVGLFHTDA